MIDPPEKQQKKKLWNYFTNIIGVIIIALLAWYLYENQNIFSYLKNIRLYQIVWIIVIDFASFLIISLLNLSIIRRFDPTVNFLDSYLLTYANNFLNKILPTIGGGATFRAVFLKKKYKFPYSQFISTLAGFYVMSFFSVSIIGLICIFVLFIEHAVFNWVIFLTFLLLFLGSLLTIVFSPKVPETKNRILSILKSIFEGWDIIKKEPKSIFIYTFFSVVLLFLSALQILISYQALGIHTSLLSMLFLSTLGNILLFLNFTPDEIGVREIVYIFSSKLVQIPNNILVLGSLVIRAVSICSTFIIGGICYFVLSRRLKELV